ncbi:MAG: L-threonylcarbamoyladenylate synthase [Betaproteobacteria bacterium]
MAGAADIERAVAVLRLGGLVAFPTETVYGLGADASNPQAVARIFAAKGRPADHPVIVHLAEAGQLPQWARRVPEAARRLAAAYWPGPLTRSLPRAAGVSAAVTGGQDSVGIRVPSHPVAQALLRAFGGGIAAPSANRFGRISPTRAGDVRAELGDAVDLVLEGEAPAVGIESAIVDLSGARPALLRPGMLGAAALEAVLGEPLAAPGAGAPRASGTLAAHYAPRTRLRLLAPGALERALAGEGSGAAVLARRAAPAGVLVAAWRAAPADAEGYARHLYASLRELDAVGASCILVEAPPEDPAWEAVRDRLARAAAGAGAPLP